MVFKKNNDKNIMIAFLTNKYYNNRPRVIKELTRTQLFFSDRNVSNLIASVYGIKLKYGYNTPIEELRPFVISLMRKWAQDKNLDGVDILGSTINSYLQALKFINTNFLRDNYDTILRSSPLSREADFNVRGIKYQTGSIDPALGKYDIRLKSQKELMAHDYGSIDVWAEVRTDLSSDIYRYENRIPFDRLPAHNRHYDRTNDGLDYTADNSSLLNPIRGYGADYEEYTRTHTDDRDRNTIIRYPSTYEDDEL